MAGTFNLDSNDLCLRCRHFCFATGWAGDECGGGDGTQPDHLNPGLRARRVVARRETDPPPRRSCPAAPRRPRAAAAPSTLGLRPTLLLACSAPTSRRSREQRHARSSLAPLRPNWGRRWWWDAALPRAEEEEEEQGTTPLDPAAAAAGGSLHSAPSLAEEAGGPDRRADRGAPPASLLRLGSRPTRPRAAR
jgi:hypothetical protein